MSLSHLNNIEALPELLETYETYTPEKDTSATGMPEVTTDNNTTTITLQQNVVKQESLPTFQSTFHRQHDPFPAPQATHNKNVEGLPPFPSQAELDLEPCKFTWAETKGFIGEYGMHPMG